MNPDPLCAADQPMYDIDPLKLPVLEWARMMTLAEDLFSADMRLCEEFGIRDAGLRFNVVQMVAMLFKFSERAARYTIDLMFSRTPYETLKDAAMDVAASLAERAILR